MVKMEHPRPLQWYTNLCIIFAHIRAGVIFINDVLILLLSKKKIIHSQGLDIFVLHFTPKIRVLETVVLQDVGT